MEISKLHKNPLVKQNLTIAQMRACLAKQIKDFLHAASSFLPSLEEADLKAFADESIDTPVEESVELEELLKDPIDEDYYEDDESEVECMEQSHMAAENIRECSG